MTVIAQGLSLAADAGWAERSVASSRKGI